MSPYIDEGDVVEGEKRAQAERFGAQMQAALDEEWTQSSAGHENGLDSGDPE